MNIRNTPLYAESWNVAFRQLGQGSILEDLETEFVVVPNSFRYWAADPMIFQYNGSIYLFAELYDYVRTRGIIGVSVFDGKAFGKWEPIIIEKTHMSYPFVFVENNDIYMVPETSKSNNVVLYKATKFPYRWEKIKTIVSGVRWVDTTLQKRESGFVGFTESINETIVDYELTIDNEFNIVDKKEIAESGDHKHRCGGRLFRCNNYLVKVTQDCSKEYGAALVFRMCNVETMMEGKSIYISPHQLKFNKEMFITGMHTYTAIESMEVIDIKTRRLSFLNLVFRLLAKVKKYQK